MNMPPNLSIVIVSYNTRALTLSCLRCLYGELRLSGLDQKSEVLLVDNGSRDGSADAVRAEFPAVKVIARGKNEGFGVANNRGMDQALGEWIVLLNTDAFPKPGALAALLTYGNSHPEAAVIGPRLLNPDGTLQVSCWKFPTPLRAWLDCFGLTVALSGHPFIGDYYYWPHDRQRYVQFVVGACMLVRRAAYEKVGGFDPRFFFYAEETDWQKRLTEAGWRIAFTPDAQVVHLRAASREDKATVNPHLYRGADIYMQKHYGLLGLLSMRLASILGNLTRMLFWSVVPREKLGQRKTLTAKTRQHGWVLLRQLTHWPVDRGKSSAGMP